MKKITLFRTLLLVIFILSVCELIFGHINMGGYVYNIGILSPIFLFLNIHHKISKRVVGGFLWLGIGFSAVVFSLVFCLSLYGLTSVGNIWGWQAEAFQPFLGILYYFLILLLWISAMRLFKVLN